MFSVYTSLFNYSPEKFDLVGALSNWSKYADKIFIATFPEQKEEIFQLIWKEWYNGSLSLEGGTSKAFVDVVSCETSLDDPLFDGKLKNAALQACQTELVIQVDMDERLHGNLSSWEDLGKILKDAPTPFAFMIPVIDLYKDYDHYKGVNRKWYFHLKEGSFRGPVNFAKKDGNLIDINKSDSCELIDKNGDLVPYYIDDRFFCKTANIFDIKQCHVIHLGYLNLSQRVENNKFWRGVWSARAGEEVKVAQSIEELDAENIAKKHNLKPCWWI